MHEQVFQPPRSPEYQGPPLPQQPEERRKLGEALAGGGYWEPHCHQLVLCFLGSYVAKLSWSGLFPGCHTPHWQHTWGRGLKLSMAMCDSPVPCVQPRPT